ncbi:hypothetical protein PROFUN_13531 [Planoprotostelium fungivorum]|uniref:Ion transport domain-containing protein n=1 Tax=Planoprotostelium fungivorum TaxID=1890364 RepID=A0A2P6N3K5_9EUKA|nr:hypothetical protein PROFUN_13531 [Planoprotostelium fungivorum]
MSDTFWESQLVNHRSRVGQRGITLDEVPQDVLHEALRYVNEAIEIEQRKLNRKPLDQFLHSRSFKNFTLAVIILHLLLAYIELPNDYEYKTSLSILALVLELGCLAVWTTSWVLRYIKNGRKKFFSGAWTTISLIGICLTLLDIIVALFRFDLSFRLSLIFLADLTQSTRRQTKLVIFTFLSMVRVLVILWIVILFYTIVGMVLIQGIVPGDTYFINFTESLLNMITCLSTANFPEVMIQSYNYSRWYTLYFLSFYSICLYFGMNLVLAFGYSQFQQIATQELVKKYMVQRKKLLEAFYILDEAETRAIRTSFITKQTFYRLVVAGNPGCSDELTDELDKMSSKTVSPLNYFRLCDQFIMQRLNQWSWTTLSEHIPTGDFHPFGERLTYVEYVPRPPPNSRPGTPKKGGRSTFINVQGGDTPMEDEDRHTFFSRDPINYNRWKNIFGHWLVVDALVILTSDRSVEAVLCSLLIGNGIVTIVTLDQAQVTLRNTLIADTILLFIFLAESGLRIYFLKGLKRSWNKFDLGILMTSLAGKIVIEFILLLVEDKETMYMLKLGCLFRTIRILRIFSVVVKTRQLVRTITRLMTLIGQYAIIIYAVYYIFAVIGICAFNGVLVRGQEKLEGTGYDQGDYYKLVNFNSFDSTMLTLFHLMVVNNWFVTMRAVMAVVGDFASIYFVVWYQTIVAIILNLAVAFTIEALKFLTSREDQQKDMSYNRRQIERGEKKSEWDQFTLSQLEEKILDRSLKTETIIEVENRKQKRKNAAAKKESDTRRQLFKENPEDIQMETVMRYKEHQQEQPLQVKELDARDL